MELSLLYYFKTVAEQENITKAAELLYISQPALSKAIAKLEKSLDVTLFERRKGRISLSAMGRDRIFQANTARLYHYTIHYFKHLGQELHEYFGQLLPEQPDVAKKGLGINHLKG